MEWNGLDWIDDEQQKLPPKKQTNKMIDAMQVLSTFEQQNPQELNQQSLFNL